MRYDALQCCVVLQSGIYLRRRLSFDLHSEVNSEAIAMRYVMSHSMAAAATSMQNTK
jgi:hypothetical protein